MRRIQLVIVAAVLLASTASASAATSSHRRHLRCQTGYVTRDRTVRERRHGRRVKVRVSVCVAKPVRHVVKPKASTSTTTTPVPAPTTTATTPSPVATPAPTPVASPAPAAPTITVRLDPSFTQSATSPEDVVYSFSASAVVAEADPIASPNGADAAGTTDADGSDGSDGSDDSLPDGVLNLYTPLSPDQPAGLVCSLNVGGAVTGGSCPVDYTATGTYPVTVEFDSSSTTPATQTTYETIAPFSTTTTLTETTYPESGSSNATTNYTPSIVDENGNVVPFDQSAISFVIVDSTTGQTIGSLSSVDGDFFQIGPSPRASICNSPYPLGACVGPVNLSDSLTVAVVYAPPSGGAWSGSTSTALPLALSDP